MSGMKTEAMDATLRGAAEHLRDNYDMRDHGRAGASYAQQFDDDFPVDRFLASSVPLEVAVPRFERLAKLGLDFAASCLVRARRRDGS